MAEFWLAKVEDLVTDLYEIDGAMTKQLGDPIAHKTTERKLTKTFFVTGECIHTEYVGHRRRRRRFMITHLEVMWVDGNLRSVTARGPTYLANDTISKQSNGFAYWSPQWNLHGELPDEISTLVKHHDSLEFG